MYRVELKGRQSGYVFCSTYFVPNVPCGVERYISEYVHFCLTIVPNVPCGVERNLAKLQDCSPVPFLMYRVELKES